MKVFRILESLPRQDGLMPLYLDVHKARFTTQHVSLGPPPPPPPPPSIGPPPAPPPP